MTETSKNWIYRFVIDEKYRLYRHVLLAVFLIIIAIDSALWEGYSDHSGYVGDQRIYILIFLYALVYILVVFSNLYGWVPKLLLRQKYFQYGIVLFLSVLFLVLVDLALEYLAYYIWGIPLDSSSMWYSWYNFITQLGGMTAVGLMFVVGISSIVFFRNWTFNEQMIKELENRNLQSQIEMTKEQVSPSFLSRILKQAALLTEDDPQKSSGMLLKLSKVLRYQLYDCQRESVLLKSEVEFLSNYLELERAYATDFEFRIHCDKDTGILFIPPFQVLLPVQNYVQEMREKSSNPKTLDVSFMKESEGLVLVINSTVSTSVRKLIMS